MTASNCTSTIKQQPSSSLPRSGKLMGFTRRVWIVSLGVVGLCIWLKRSLMPTHRYLPWHQTKQWVHFLQVYDKQLNKYYTSRGCASKLIATTYGGTHVAVCGSPDDKPVFFFHGGASNGLFYGDWIVPKIVSKNRYAIVVDALCDTGRSVPFNSDPKNCPSTNKEMADWIRQLITHPDLNAKAPASLVGYSYGSQMSFLTARYHPNLVDKLALLAPACMFDNINPMFLWRYLVVALFRSRYTLEWFWTWMSGDPNFTLSKSVSQDQLQNLVEGNYDVGAFMLNVKPEEYEDDVLKQVASRHDIFIATGTNERAYQNWTRALERAKTAGVKTIQVYPDVGHLMCVEIPGTIEQDVVNFLTK